MISRSEQAEARKRAGEMIRAAGLPVSNEDLAEMEVADFGLSDLPRTGAQILTLVDTERKGVRIIVLFPDQVLPEHRHPPVGDDPGKEETLWLISGRMSLFVENEGAGARTEIIMRPGDRYTLVPGTPHRFRGGDAGAVLVTFATTTRDALDVFADPHVVRKTAIGGTLGGT